MITQHTNFFGIRYFKISTLLGTAELCGDEMIMLADEIKNLDLKKEKKTKTISDCLFKGIKGKYGIVKERGKLTIVEEV